VYIPADQFQPISQNPYQYQTPLPYQPVPQVQTLPPLNQPFIPQPPTDILSQPVQTGPVTKQQAYDLADQIQTPVKNAMAHAAQSGNSQAVSLAGQAYNKAFSAVNLAQSGQYGPSVQAANEALALAAQVMSM
jgi:hypothetical protein